MSPAFDWRQYLVVAERLAEWEPEALKRTAASRAYYAVFNVCREWLERHGLAFGGASVHRHIWNAFAGARYATAPSASDWRRVGAHGRTLNELRNECDYDAAVGRLEERVTEAVVLARHVIDELLPRLEIV